MSGCGLSKACEEIENNLQHMNDCLTSCSLVLKKPVSGPANSTSPQNCTQQNQHQ